jgi:hypothetical protein
MISCSKSISLNICVTSNPFLSLGCVLDICSSSVSFCSIGDQTPGLAHSKQYCTTELHPRHWSFETGAHCVVQARHEVSI